MLWADDGNLISGGPTDLRVGSNTILKKKMPSHLLSDVELLTHTLTVNTIGLSSWA